MMGLPCVHEFGILHDFDKQKIYRDYEPQKYHCISIDDDIIGKLVEQLSIIKTYFHSFTRPNDGLAYWGITIIPPESLSLFYEVVTSFNYIMKSNELQELALIIMQAMEEKQYLIHFGI